MVETTLKQKGMKDRSPKAPSDKPKGGSVDSETTRKETARTPATLGPRCA
jgi:hypothetical protein